MAEDQSAEHVVPVISEEVHASAIPVETGSVRVVKRVEGHDEILQQELRKGRVEVKRIQVNRVVDGPQPSRREGSTLIVPVVSEVLKVVTQWVVTEEIHITQFEERETVQQKVSVNHEVAEVERLDDQGNLVSTIAADIRPLTTRTVGDLPAPTAPLSRSGIKRERSLLAGKSGSIVKKT